MLGKEAEKIRSQALDRLSLSALRDFITTFAVLSQSAAFLLVALLCVSLIRDRSSDRKRCAISRYTQRKQFLLHSCVNQVKGHKFEQGHMHLSSSRGSEVTGVCTVESRCLPSPGILQGYCSFCLDGFMFPWEETDFCNEMT